MSETPSIQGKDIYIVLYNYSDCDYSIVKIMETLDDAYKYICYQESNVFPYPLENVCKMIKVFRPDEIPEKIVKDFINVCYLPSGNYIDFNVCQYENVSDYAIIQKKIVKFVNYRQDILNSSKI
jgi:hypothetical protein